MYQNNIIYLPFLATKLAVLSTISDCSVKDAKMLPIITYLNTSTSHVHVGST